MKGTARERRAAAPPAHHLRRDQLLLRWILRVRLEVAAERSDSLMQLAERHIGAVASEHLGVRNRGPWIELVGVAEDQLAGLERLLARVRSGDPGALDGRVAYPVAESERLALAGGHVAALPPGCLDPCQRFVGLAST